MKWKGFFSTCPLRLKDSVQSVGVGFRKLLFTDRAFLNNTYSAFVEKQASIYEFQIMKGVQ